MIPDLQCALVCEDVRLEVAGGNTLVGVINTIAAPQIPIRLIKLCIFSRWCSGHGTFKQATRVLDLEENILAHTETTFRLEREDSHATNVAVFGGVEFSEAGAYPIEIILDDELVLRFPLRVHLGPK